MAASSRGLRRVQPEVDAERHVEAVGSDLQGVERQRNIGAVVWIEHQVAPLLDKGTRQRVAERLGGQGDGRGAALTHVAAFVSRAERQAHFGAGPGMVGRSSVVLPSPSPPGIGGKVRGPCGGSTKARPVTVRPLTTGLAKCASAPVTP